MTHILLLALVLATATLSGVFGMAGGLLLMGGLMVVLPVSAAMVTHGAVQVVSNGWRAMLHRKHVRWQTLGFYAIGSALAGAALALLTYEPSKAWVFLLLGLVPGLAWLPKERVHLDAANPGDAAACGLLVTGLNVAAGVSGPLLDVFFIRTAMTRHQIVATKAATQVLAHIVKIVFYGAPLLALSDGAGMPPLWFFLIAWPLAALGAVFGGIILDRMSDVNFLKWSRWIVTATGAVYLAQAAQLFLAR